MFAGAGLVFIVTGLICGFVRFRHCCRPFSEHEEYFYPARKQVAVFYAAVALSFPYILAPEDPAVWTYVRIYNRKNEMCRVGKRNAMVLVENEM